MLTVYSGENGYPIMNDDYYIRYLASGLDEIVFNVSIRDEVYQYITEENRIRDRDQNYYIIKQIDAGNEKAKVVAQIDIDDWKATMYQKYTNNSATVVNTVLSVLPVGWSCIDRSLVSIRRTIPTSDTTTDYNVTAWKVLQDCCNVYKVRFRFDTANKIVYIVNPDNYTNAGAFATRDLNLKDLNFKGKSTDFCTRLYAEGADGLTFEDINNGKPYVENFSYSTKIISAYWKDERYTDAQSLLDDATAKLNAACVPQRSYDCDVLDLKNTNPEMYGFENFDLFSVITLIDDAKQERLEYQVVEKWDYPYYPVNNKVVLSTETPKIQSQVLTLIEAVNSATSPFQMMLQSAIANSTALITGNHGGYVALHDSDGNGTPDEILIMDTDDIETAQNVWRWNKNGLGFSSTGYNGTYGTAITADGSIVASFITSGLMRGDRIEAGTLDTSALSVSAREELNVVHNYLPVDLFDNIARAKLVVSGSGSADCYYENITAADGVTYKALVLDGVNLGGGSAYIDIASDYVSNPAFTWSYKMQVDRAHSFNQSQRFFYFEYYNEDENDIFVKNITWFNPSQPVAPNVMYSLKNTASISRKSTAYTRYDGSYPSFKFDFVTGIKIYLLEFSVTGTVDSYKRSSLSYSADGLDSIVVKGDIISSINQTAEQVSINASRIDLTGNLSLRGDFHSYKPSDNTTYAFLDSGNLSFYNSGANVFTVAATPLLGNKAGIFFGDKDDPASMARYTNINQDRVTAPQMYVRTDGRYDSWISSSYPCVIEGDMKASQIFMKTLTVQAQNDGWNSRIEGGVVFAPASYSASSGSVTFESTVYNSSGGVVFVSDKRKKKNIKKLVLDKAKAFIMALKPKEFKFKDGTSDRKHHGFIAQEVQAAMYEDWGLYVENTDTDFIGLRYDEVIADLVAVVQDQEKRIEALEKALERKVTEE